MPWPVAGSGDARERLVAAAYELFTRRGVQAVGVDAIIERSGVARQTMYRHFASKRDLVLAVLERRDELWTRDWLVAGAQSRADTPRGRLLAVFDLFDEWFRQPGYEGCSFINVMLEHPERSHPLHRAAASYLAGIRHFLQDLAGQAGIGDAEDFAREWHLLMKGAIVAASEGDTDAALRAKAIATLALRRATGTDRRTRPRPRALTPRHGTRRSTAQGENGGPARLPGPAEAILTWPDAR